jgi:hypoxanthine phosphoribosyltransferase
VTQLEYDEAIGRRLYTAEEIDRAIERLADQIAADHAGQPLLLVGVLKGGLCFTTDLARALARKANGPSEIIVDYICVERYGASTGGDVSLVMDAGLAVAGASVVVVEDIADHGVTLEFLQALLKERRPASLRSCVLFDKPARRGINVPIDYAGLEVPDTFVIGYGLDYKELYRNLPYLAELRENPTV